MLRHIHENNWINFDIYLNVTKLQPSSETTVARRVHNVLPPFWKGCKLKNRELSSSIGQEDDLTQVLSLQSLPNCSNNYFAYKFVTQRYYK